MNHWKTLLSGYVCSLGITPVLAQPPLPDMQLYQQPVTPYAQPAPLRIQDFSRTYIQTAPPREIKVQDIITILVDEKSEVTVSSGFDRQRNATYKAQLNEFVRFSEDGNLTGAAEESPTIDTQMQSRLQSSGRLTDREGITYRIAATIVDVLPNGNVVLEARKTIRTNQDVWEYTLTGVMRSQDISNNFSAQSSQIANLQIVKTQKGKVYDSTKRPWGTRLLDKLSPF